MQNTQACPYIGSVFLSFSLEGKLEFPLPDALPFSPARQSMGQETLPKEYRNSIVPHFTITFQGHVLVGECSSSDLERTRGYLRVARKACLLVFTSLLLWGSPFISVFDSFSFSFFFHFVNARLIAGGNLHI